MKKLSVILVIIWMIVIFMFSSYNGNISSMQSDGIVAMLARLIHYTGDIDILRVIVRKMAHFTEYLILGILCKLYLLLFLLFYHLIFLMY